jgi:hypothetical protein
MLSMVKSLHFSIWMFLPSSQYTSSPADVSYSDFEYRKRLHGISLWSQSLMVLEDSLEEVGGAIIV